ncbi:hypothetical protein BC826DRAFT_1179241 [Russula brevipes]|nr:hypothetical protein BC826DRAFT_1179241 [Russula brevipes]
MELRTAFLSSSDHQRPRLPSPVNVSGLRIQYRRRARAAMTLTTKIFQGRSILANSVRGRRGAACEGRGSLRAYICNELMTLNSFHLFLPCVRTLEAWRITSCKPKRLSVGLWCESDSYPVRKQRRSFLPSRQLVIGGLLDPRRARHHTVQNFFQ